MASFTPDDVFDIAAECGLGWDDATRTGFVFHMVSAVGVAGRLGLTAIGDSPGSAEALYRATEAVLSDAVRR